MQKSVDLCQMCFSYVMDELTLFENRRFVKHMKHCLSCQEEYAELRELRHHAEMEFGTKRHDPVVLCLHPFSRQVYWLAASAMALLIGLTISIPHHHQLLGKFRDTALDVHEGIADHVAQLDNVAAHLLRFHGDHVSLRIPEI